MPKITELTADTAPSFDDLIVTVNDPGVSPATKKITLTDLFKLIRFWGFLAADPDTTGWGATEQGRFWYNTTDNQWRFWNASEILLMG